MNNVLITGGTSGLGLALATQFLTAGKKVYILGRNADKIGELLAEPRCKFVFSDLTDSRDLEKTVDFVKTNQIDCFISNAGLYSDKGTLISAAECRDLISVNLVAPVLLLKEAYEVFKNQGAGVIVAINSVAGLSPNFKEAVYSASKHGLKGFIGSLQAEAYKYNIKVMEYYLGAMQTPMTAMRDGFAELMKTSEVAEVIVRDVLSTNALVPIRQEIRKFPARK